MIQFNPDSAVTSREVSEGRIDLKIFSHAQIREKEALFTQKLIRYSVITGLVGWLFGFVIAALIGAVQVKDVKLENITLRYHVDTFQHRLNDMESRVNQIAFRDRAIYQMLFNLDSASEMPAMELAPAGLSYENPGQYSSPEITPLSNTHTDELQQRIAYQSQSLTDVLRWQDNFLEDLRQIPAIKPADGAVSSYFGMRVHPILGVPKFHNGVDIAVNIGTPVYATASGVVTAAGYDKTLGHYVKILHKNTNLYTLYAHLSRIPDAVYRDKKVDRGTLIGYSGNTGLSAGPHLHYEIQHADGKPVDPADYILFEVKPASLNPAAG